ncbi:MAG TPA: molybdopterin-dependent oxidoreductase [Anaeromyxobacteraceae bacterium]|nr:molybdopterin-dependent oxidoreductase [Anaeromyxobacteraceae bacterium]
MIVSTRRSFCQFVGFAALSGFSCDSSRPRAGFLGFMERVNERVQRALFDPGRLVPELPEEEQTDLDEFPPYKISSDFPVAPAGWALSVGGLVSRRLVLSLDALKRLPGTHMRVRHYCVEGWSAVASWQGVRLRDIARLAAVDSRARYVEFKSFDSGYYSSWDLESALHPQTIIAYGMNGEPLSAEHGAPVRLYSAVKLGYKMVKYLSEVNFLPLRTGGYWEDKGYEWFAGV